MRSHPSATSLAPHALALGASLLLCACSLDGLLIQELSRNNHRLMPDPAPVTITGRVPSIGGARIRLLGAGGPLVAGAITAGKDGAFTIQLDGTTELVNAVIEAAHGAQKYGAQKYGVLPFVPKQKSVLDPELKLDIKQLSPGMANIDDVTTAMALLVAARAKLDDRALVAIPHGSMTDTLIELHGRLATKDPILLAVLGSVQRIALAAKNSSVGKSAAQKSASATKPERPYDLFASGSMLRQAFISAVNVDADGDGKADTSSAPFDKLIAKATATFKFKACYVEGKIKVVLMARLSTNAKNRNCDTIDPFLWATDVPGKKMLLTGGVHKTTPVCTADVKKDCLTAKQVDQLNATLGNWVPNRISMYDDGSHGDGTAADGIWTFAFDAPWWAVADGGRGVRIGYKFTWGNDGAGWGGTEEFPGNMRILELKDVNGDRIITRLDLFADEASNKDKANQLVPVKGGCGSLHWPDEKAAPGCVTDVHERAVDLDGDCKIDGFPGSGTSAPLTVQCPEGG